MDPFAENIQNLFQTADTETKGYVTRDEFITVNHNHSEYVYASVYINHLYTHTYSYSSWSSSSISQRWTAHRCCNILTRQSQTVKHSTQTSTHWAKSLSSGSTAIRTHLE